jgi:hypothetical protein
MSRVALFTCSASLAVALACARAADSRSYDPVRGPDDAPEAGAGDEDASFDLDAGNFGGPCKTSISGIVHTPSKTDPDPLYNAIVYLPVGPLEPFVPGVSCDQCGTVTGHASATALTGPDGAFRIDGVKAGLGVPIVVQMGRWRRQAIIPEIKACQDNVLDAELTRFPRNHTEGDIPQIAITTGVADAIECVLRRIGIDEAEFTLPSGSGRVHLYHTTFIDPDGTTQVSSGMGPATPDASALWSDPANLKRYDMVLFACEGSEAKKSPTATQNIIDYTSAGGRVFATHFEYTWIAGAQAPFAGAAQWSWQVDAGFFLPADPLEARVDTSFPKGAALLAWLKATGATDSSGVVEIGDPRYDVVAVVPPTQRWVYSVKPPTLQHMTFNTPVGAADDKQCGRVVYSDFHVQTASTAALNTGDFPSECKDVRFSPRERLLEFMLFDLASCVQNDGAPPVPPPPR